MGKENRYLLNLHYNSKYSGQHNSHINYEIAENKYLLALYDKSFYSLYGAGGKEKGTYYGTITTSCYSFDGTEFKFLIVYPEVNSTLPDRIEANFVLGKIVLEEGKKFLLHNTSRGTQLSVYDSATKKIEHENVYGYFSEGSTGNLVQDCVKRAQGKVFRAINSTSIVPIGRYNNVITIPQYDIKENRGAGLDGSKYYLLDPNSTTDEIELKEFDIQSGRSALSVSGRLANTTTLVQETDSGRSSDRYVYHLWSGNPFTGTGEVKGELLEDASIALFRKNGDFKYYSPSLNNPNSVR